MKILYVHATLVPPPTDLQSDRFYLPLRKDRIPTMIREGEAGFIVPGEIQSSWKRG
jgi:hypothetical protein